MMRSDSVRSSDPVQCTSMMKTSDPLGDKVESTPTVVQLSENNNANEKPFIVSSTLNGDSEPNYCCFKARNYILFILICILILYLYVYEVFIIKDTYFFDSDKDEYFHYLQVLGDRVLLSSYQKIISWINITITAIGILGVSRRSSVVINFFLAGYSLIFTCQCITFITVWHMQHGTRDYTQSLSSSYISTINYMESIMEYISIIDFVAIEIILRGIFGISFWTRPTTVTLVADELKNKYQFDKLKTLVFTIYLISHVLVSIFLVFIPVFKYARFLRKKGAIRSFRKKFKNQNA